MLPHCVVATQGERRTLVVHVPDGDPVSVTIDLETGGVRQPRQLDRWVEPREVDGALVGEATFEVPQDLPLGYHTLRAVSGDREADCTLIVTPSWLGLPDRLGERRGWGFAAQLYSVRSRGSWGVGDLTDLTDLAVWSAADLGADYVLVNPLHAAEPVAPLEPSPYLPSSRRFFHPMYLRVERIPEYVDLEPAARQRVDALRQQVDTGDVIDRDASWSAKRDALLLVHAVPRSAGRETDYRAYRARQGRALHDLATWNVLAQHHGNDARTWPAGLDDPASPEVAAFATEHADAVDFEMWLQWLLDEQLEHAQSRAVDGRHGAGHDARPRGRRAPRRCRRVAIAVVVRHGDAGRAPHPTRSTSSARTGASRRGGPTGWLSSATRRSATSSRPCCGMPEACGSTTSSACSGSGGSRRADRRRRAPTCATTTRR